jgi:tetratricopeptide (TPR) repeat protein
MKLSQGKLALLVLFVLVSTSGCGVINRIRAKNELNEAARAYKAGKFAEAEQHSKRALDLDPEQKTAPTFIARSIHAQYRPGVDTPQNKQKATDAVEAYKRILEKNPSDEEAYKAIAALYGAVDENQQRQWIMQRASDDKIAKEKRAEAYTILASKDWNCSYTITEQPSNKKTEMKDGKPVIVFQKPKEQKDLDSAQQCVARGMEEAEKAIGYDPNNDAAWSFKTNLLLESAKLAEMNGDQNKKMEFTKQAEAAQKRTTELSEQNQKRKDEEEKKKAAQKPQQPAS